MMSYSYIQDLAAEAARKARRHGRKPISLSGLGEDAVLREMRAMPFLGAYVPKGFERVDVEGPRRMACDDGYLFVDSSGFGTDGEPALSVSEFVDYASRNRGQFYGIAEAGQFQVVVAVYREKQKAPRVCPVCEDSACETKSAECGK